MKVIRGSHFWEISFDWCSFVLFCFVLFFSRVLADFMLASLSAVQVVFTPSMSGVPAAALSWS